MVKVVKKRIDDDLTQAGLPGVVICLPDEVADDCEFNEYGEQTLEAGTYFKIKKLNSIEAEMTEVTVRDGLVTEKRKHVDVARIILGKLIRKVGDSYGI